MKRTTVWCSRKINNARIRVELALAHEQTTSAISETELREFADKLVFEYRSAEDAAYDIFNMILSNLLPKELYVGQERLDQMSVTVSLNKGKSGVTVIYSPKED